MLIKHQGLRTTLSKFFKSMGSELSETLNDDVDLVVSDSDIKDTDTPTIVLSKVIPIKKCDDNIYYIKKPFNVNDLFIKARKIVESHHHMTV